VCYSFSFRLDHRAIVNFNDGPRLNNNNNKQWLQILRIVCGMRSDSRHILQTVSGSAPMCCHYNLGIPTRRSPELYKLCIIIICIFSLFVIDHTKWLKCQRLKSATNFVVRFFFLLHINHNLINMNPSFWCILNKIIGGGGRIHFTSLLRTPWITYKNKKTQTSYYYYIICDWIKYSHIV